MKKTFSRKVEFIGLGPNKTGSTWLADMLRLHPQVFIPAEKTILYFNRFSPESGKPNKNYILSYDWYQSNFAKAKDTQLIGEFGMVYFYMENCAKEILKYNPAIKFIVVLRHPIERLISQFTFRQQVGLSKKTSLKQMLNDNPRFLDTGLYFKHLNRFFDYFPEPQIKILFYEELKKDAALFYKSILDFLKLDIYFPETIHERSNVTSEFYSKKLISHITKLDIFLREQPKLKPINNFLRSPAIHKHIKWLTKINRKSAKEKPTFDHELLNEIQAYYFDDICKLEKMLSIDLSRWKSINNAFQN